MKKYLIVYAHAGGAVNAEWGIFRGMDPKDAIIQARTLDTADPGWHSTLLYLVVEVKTVLQEALK
jgi:hypothetical protein